MARMVPFPMLPTASSAERRLYEGFLTQLSDEYVVFHSVDRVLAPDRAGGTPIQGECDFLIAHPVDGLLVLEAKGGGLAYDPATRRWIQIGHDGGHPLAEDPFHQARDEMHSLVQILSAQPGWEKWMPSYGYGVAFPDATYKEDAHPGAPAAVAIDHRHMSDLAGRVKAIMRHWGHSGRTFGAEGMEALERALGFRVEMRLPLRLRFEEQDRKIVELTNDQAYVLSFVTKRGRAAVVGPAGSGKTMLAVSLAKRLAASGERTLLTCFNWRLAAYLRGSTEGTLGLDVFHFHDLARQLAQAAGISVPDPPTDAAASDPYYEITLPGLLMEATKVLGPPYRAIVVDEAQDFRSGWWPALLSLHQDPDHGHLFLFSDDNQNLYEGAIPDRLVDQTFPLTANLRNAQPIHEFVSVFHEGAVRPAGLGPPGPPVEVLGYRDDDDLARLLVLVLKNLQAEEVPLEDIVVLTPGGEATSALRRRATVDGFRLSADVEPGTVLACSVHSFKGLERPVVILAELDGRREADLERYLYVGGSRARDHLIVLATQDVATRLRQLAGVAKP